jgi:hypothetical protein
MGPTKSTKALDGKTIDVDSTILDADAGMTGIVQHGSREEWQPNVISLMRIDRPRSDGKRPTGDEPRRFERQSERKEVSREDWKKPTDTESKIRRIEEGLAHVTYDERRALELNSGILVTAEEVTDDNSGPMSSEYDLHHTQSDLDATSDCELQEVAGEKEIHPTEALGPLSSDTNYLAYMSQLKVPSGTSRSKCTREKETLVLRNCRRDQSKMGLKLRRMPSHQEERAAAHHLVTNFGRFRRIRELAFKETPRYLETYTEAKSAMEFSRDWCHRVQLTTLIPDDKMTTSVCDGLANFQRRCPRYH